jgi:hypothetical protein
MRTDSLTQLSRAIDAALEAAAVPALVLLASRSPNSQVGRQGRRQEGRRPHADPTSTEPRFRPWVVGADGMGVRPNGRSPALTACSIGNHTATHRLDSAAHFRRRVQWRTS